MTDEQNLQYEIHWDPAAPHSEQTGVVLVVNPGCTINWPEAARTTFAKLTQEQRAQVMAGFWQPIETAPKDGTPILGYADGKMTTVEWIKGGCPLEGGWNLAVSGAWAENAQWTPIHWMPLPEPLKGD